MIMVVMGLVQADSLYAIWPQQTKLTASDGNALDQFGLSVSISGDYAIVGGYFDDDKGEASGSAYIFKYNGTTWSEQQKLTASDGAESDFFGYSVSISGNHAIVGVPGDDDKGYGSGSAYFFKYNGTTWVEQQKLTASDGAADDFFGCSVSINRDYAVVGAMYDDANGYASGSAYIFKYDGSTWSEQKKLTASDGEEGDFFGCSVSINGDYAMIGADSDDDKGDGSGSVYIFKGDGTNWSEQVKLTAPDGVAYYHFGFSVSLNVDYSINGDYAIIGAFGDDDKGNNCGSAYIFKYNGTTWIEQQKLTASDGNESDYFGGSVSISGDYAIIGAYYAQNKGSAYIFKYDGTTWMEQTKLTASDGVASDNFGRSVSISGDHVTVGASYDDDKGTDSGSAYIFMNGMPCWQCTMQPYGDINGDGSINAADYFYFKKSYGTGWVTHSHGTEVGQYNCCCDLNHDTKVNAADYFIFKQNYGETDFYRCDNHSCL